MSGISSPDIKLQQLLEQVRDWCQRIATSTNGDGQRPWMVPEPDSEGWEGDLTSAEQVKYIFDRSKADEAYTTTLFQGGETYKCAAHNVEIAYLSNMERAFRARHRSFCRSAAHATARRTGHGDEGGVHIGQVLQFVQDLLGIGANK